MTSDKLKQFVALIGGALGALLLFLQSLGYEFLWFNNDSISKFADFLNSLVPLILIGYGIYKNQYFGKKAKGQEEFLKRSGWK